MTIETFDPKLAITLSDTAQQHIRKEIAAVGGNKLFRLYLQTSGCSGYMYETELVDSATDDDQNYAFDDITVLVPKKDLAVLNGTVIDFVKVGLNSMFQFRNPNVTGECGCGESFSVTEEA